MKVHFDKKNSCFIIWSGYRFPSLREKNIDTFGTSKFL
jgi:hypothetical protein